MSQYGENSGGDCKAGKMLSQKDSNIARIAHQLGFSAFFFVTTKTIREEAIELMRPTGCATRCTIKRSGSRPSFVACMFAAMKRNFHRIAGRKALGPKFLVKPMHTRSSSFNKLVVHLVGRAKLSGVVVLPEL